MRQGGEKTPAHPKRDGKVQQFVLDGECERDARSARVEGGRRWSLYTTTDSQSRHATLMDELAIERVASTKRDCIPLLKLGYQRQVR